MFFLRKEWQDTEDGIEMVVLHWTATHQRQQPNWKRMHATTVMNPQPGTYPLLRTCQLCVTSPFSPKQAFAPDAEDHLQFLLHSFYEVTQRSRIWSTEVTVQRIRAETVIHHDTTGEYTQASLYYSLHDFTQGNRTPMWIEGLPVRYQQPPVLPENEAGDKEYRLWAKRVQLLAQLPPPHLFRGLIWGPVGARALYSIHLSRQWTYNPFAENGLWLLQNGRPWQIEL